MKYHEIAELIGEFRELLGRIAVDGPSDYDEDYSDLRSKLTSHASVEPLLPDFVIECRTARNFWNYIQQAYDGTGAYRQRSRYIEAQLIPLERQFRPERQKAPGVRPPEVRIEYSPVRPVGQTTLGFINDNRLAELRSIASGDYDLRKLIRICEELNIAYAEGCYLATALLTRTLLDHVPPVFEKRTFIEVANNYGGKSFKDAMQHLEKSARKIADTHLHQPVRRRESLPAPQQVNFSAPLDLLLGEIARLLG